MRIVRERPPIWEEAHRHFEIDDSRTFYTYGDVIHNPAGIPISADLIAHEETHARQQNNGGGPEVWWKSYFSDIEFRKKQEAEAYHNQYKFYCRQVKDRNAQAKYLHLIAGFMASPLYKLNIGSIEANYSIKYFRP